MGKAQAPGGTQLFASQMRCLTQSPALHKGNLAVHTSNASPQEVKVCSAIRASLGSMKLSHKNKRQNGPLL